MAQQPPRWTQFIITVLVILGALLALSVVAPDSPQTARIQFNAD